MNECSAQNVSTCSIYLGGFNFDTSQNVFIQEIFTEVLSSGIRV